MAYRRLEDNVLSTLDIALSYRKGHIV